MPQHKMPNPVSAFKKFWCEARRRQDPCADYIALATSAKGKPQVRTVLLKTLDRQGAGFVTQSLGPKGRLLRKNPFVSGCIVWPTLSLQVRFTGRTKPMSRSVLEKLWKNRPREAKLLYHLGIPQSSRIPSFAHLLKEISKLEKVWRGKKRIPLSPHYVGFIIGMETVEFFHHHPARLNRREFFRKTSKGWVESCLAP